MDLCFYEINEDKVKCLLCPHFCLLKKDEIGKCQRRISDGDSIFDSNYGHLTHVAVDPIEKKPFRHFLPGTKTLSIGSFGCQLHCDFCENYKISQNIDVKKTKYFSPQNIADIAIEKHCKSVCMTYNEPTISFEYLFNVANICHLNNLKFILKTNAYLNKEPWAEICRVTDSMNIDFKGSHIQYKEVCGVDGYVIEDRIKEACEANVHVEISIPLYPDETKRAMSFNSFISFLSSIDSQVPCHLLIIYPSFQIENIPPISEENLLFYKEELSKYMKNVYLCK